MDKKKILFVDDETDLVETVKFKLEANGYEVIPAYDGRQGLEKAKKEKPDLIILDLMLPKMDGHKVCGLLKKDTRFAKIPIIILTAKAQESDEKLSFEVGADAYIAKPFRYEAVLAKIKELLQE